MKFDSMRSRKAQRTYQAQQNKTAMTVTIQNRKLLP